MDDDESGSDSSGGGEDFVEIVIHEPGVGASIGAEEDFINLTRRLVKIVKWSTIFATAFLVFCALCSFGWALYVGICRVGKFPSDHFNCTSLAPDPQ